MTRPATSLATLGVATMLALAVVGGAVGATGADTMAYRLTTTMTAKQMKHPAPTGAAKSRSLLAGAAMLGSHSQVAWKLTYSGMTGRVVAALVRFKNSKGRSTVISLCVKPCKSGQTSFTLFRSKAEGRYFVNQVRAGKVDAILETKRNPSGEVRGVLKALAQSS